MHRLIPPTKNDACEPIKLLEPHRRRRVERHEAHDGRLDVRRRTEVVPAYAHHQVDFRVELHVRGEARPERGAGLRDEAQRELALEHQDCGAEERAVREEAEDERGGDLVGRVGDADVEVGQLCFHKVADDDLESTLLGPLKKRKGVFFYIRRRGFVDGWGTYLPWTRFVSSAAMRGSISTAVQCFALSSMSTVRFPVPGPTSRTLSVGRRLAWIAKVRARIGILIEKQKKPSLRFYGYSTSAFTYTDKKSDILPSYRWIFEDVLTKSFRVKYGISNGRRRWLPMTF